MSLYLKCISYKTACIWFLLLFAIWQSLFLTGVFRPYTPNVTKHVEWEIMLWSSLEKKTQCCHNALLFFFLLEHLHTGFRLAGIYVNLFFVLCNYCYSTLEGREKCSYEKTTQLAILHSSFLCKRFTHTHNSIWTSLPISINNIGLFPWCSRNYQIQ